MQPHQPPPEEEPARDSHQEPPVVTPVVIAMAVACTLTTLAAVAIGFELNNPIPAMATIRGALVGAVATSWMVYALVLLDHRVNIRLGHLQERLDGRCRTAEYAEGFVDGTARNVPRQQPLRAVTHN